MKIVWLSGGAAVMAGVLSWWYVMDIRQAVNWPDSLAPVLNNKADKMEVAEIVVPREEPVSVPVQEEITEGGSGANPVSLKALAEQEFNGNNFKVGQVLADNEAYTRYYITYQSGDLTISGIMNVPKGEGPFPLLLLNHGHIDTSVYTNGRGLKREQDYLARQGYVVIHSDYRGHAESDDDPNTDKNLRLGYAEDVINAILAVRAANLSYVDVERVGMLGHSMGGGVAWRIAVTQPDLVDAYVQFAPVSADERDNFKKWTQRRQELAQQVVELHGSPQDNPMFWDNISPIGFFNNVKVPVMIHHGMADDSVPLEWSERANAVLKADDKEVTLHIYPGEPHEFMDAWPLVMQRTTTFFDVNLKK
jgi:dipeptidyl aminopeptidase/acylaminoacyl peptidase